MLFEFTDSKWMSLRFAGSPRPSGDLEPFLDPFEAALAYAFATCGEKLGVMFGEASFFRIFSGERDLTFDYR